MAPPKIAASADYAAFAIQRVQCRTCPSGPTKECVQPRGRRPPLPHATRLRDAARLWAQLAPVRLAAELASEITEEARAQR